MKFGFVSSIGLSVLEKKIFENGGRTTDDGQRMDDGACLYYKLTNEPKGSGELKTYFAQTNENNIFTCQCAKKYHTL